MSTLLQAVQGRQINVMVLHTSGTTGLTLGSFTLLGAYNGSYVADPTTDWALALSEIDSANLPGWYRLLVTPPAEGTFQLSVTEGAYSEVFVLQAAHESLDLLGTEQSGAEGDFVVTVNDGTNPIENAVVRVYDGTEMVARGETDASGQITFGLAVGSYELRFSKDGVDFNSANPTAITVAANSSVAPVVLKILPTSAAEGDTIAIAGRYFASDAEALFDGTDVVPTAVDETLLIADVPAGLTNTLVAVQVRKPDPDNPGDYLVSNSLTLVKT